MPDIILINGDVHSLDEYNRQYEAIAVTNGKISALGLNEEILAFSKDKTTIIDLNGKTVLPGFIDAHLHLFPLGFNLSYVNCQCDSIEAVVDAIKEKAATVKTEDEWIIGWGFDESKYKEKRKLTKWDLKDIKNPVYITRYCLHEAVVNEAAMKKAQIEKDTYVTGGIIDKNERGELTGLLIEKAMKLVENVIPPRTKEEMVNAIKLANNHLLQNGFTSVYDAGLGIFNDPFKEFEVLKEACEKKFIQLNIHFMVIAEHYEQFIEQYHATSLPQLKLGAMKVFADGTLSGYTAALFKPYQSKETTGILHYSDEAMQQVMELAFKLNKQVAVHAIGDRAIDQVLRIIEQLKRQYPNYQLRPRIEHTSVSNEEIRNRMKQLQVIPVPQPTLIYLAGDMYDLDQSRLNNVFALKSFLNKDLKPAASSDAPVVDCNPFIGMYAAMKRHTLSGKSIGSDQKLNLREAVKMYTINAAYAMHEENMKGTIEKNKNADFTVLPQGFMDFTAEEVKNAAVEMTIINGKVLYEKATN